MKRLLGEEVDERGKRVRNEGPQEPNRTVYLGSLDVNVTLGEVCDIVTGGTLEGVKILGRKHCAFVTFTELEAALAFHAECTKEPPVVRGRKVVVGWGTSNLLSPDIQKAVQEGATRNVFFGGLTGERLDERWLRTALLAFGEIDCVDVLQAKRIAFVHFGSINAAMHCVQTLSQDPLWQTCRVSYGKDRCASLARRRRPEHRLPRLPDDFRDYPQLGRDFRDPRPFREEYGTSVFAPPRDSGNRTVYLGGQLDENVAKDLFDFPWGGPLEEIKVLPEKKCAFVSFLDAHDAEQFLFRNPQGEVVIRGNNFKIGWGKPRQLHRDVLRAVQEQNATRNVFLGNIDDTLTVQQLEEDLSKFGPIEKINLVPAKKIAFVNFTNIMHAINCVKELRDSSSSLSQSVYGKYRINYGKDRCARDPREPLRGRGAPPQRFDDRFDESYATRY